MAMSQGTVLWVSATTCAVSCWQTLDAEVLNPALWLSWRHIFPPGYLLQAWAKALWQDAKSEASQGCFLTQQDKKMYLSDETGARCWCHVNISRIHDLSATLSWDLKGWLHSCHEICVKDRALTLHPSSFLLPLFKSSHSKQEKVHAMPLASLCTDHTLGLVAGAQKDYSQSLELPKRLSTAEQQEWLPGSWEDASARTAVSSAAGLASSSPSSPGHLQFNILGDKKHKQVYSRGQSGHENTVSLLKTEITCASARGCSNYVSQ